MEKATMSTRKEIITRNKNRYLKSPKKVRGMILDSICLSIGLSRSRVKHLLRGKAHHISRGHKRGRKPVYTPRITAALRRVWAVMDFPCGSRLVAGMDNTLDALIRFKEVAYDEQVLALLHNISPSSADRLLKPARERLSIKGKGTTKPGTLLKRNIPIRLGTEWDENKPGFVEIDLVAHCREAAAGDYLNTLDVTDICTGWTETQAVINKAQIHAFAALKDIETRTPFPILGIDSDNGSEFINHELYRYCLEKGIKFTRSRSFRKNDNCHVEQKNWHVVRRNIGYDRYVGHQALRVMNKYYALLRLHSNFFLPQTKLISKGKEDNGRIHKYYDQPLTPYKRLLRSEHLSDGAKEGLQEFYLSLNPVQLQRDMVKTLDELKKLSVSG